MGEPQRHPAEQFFQWLGRKLFMASAAVLLGFGSMFASYWGIRWWAAERGGLLQTPAAEADREAVELHAMAGELSGLMREYLERIDRDGGPASPEFRAWINRRFSPRVNDLRRRMHDSASTSSTLTELIGAADHLAAMALQPDSPELRNRATESVFEASSAVEARIMALGLEGQFTRRD